MKGNRGGDRQAPSRWTHQGSPTPSMACEYCPYQKEQWEVEGVCGLH
jgi:hypothetical protein